MSMRKSIILLLFTACLLTESFSQEHNDGKIDTVEIDSKIFTRVEREAEFPGGVSAWISYLQKNLDANVPIKKKAPVGTYKVIVQFIVMKDGKIKDVKALTNHGYGMEKEVIRIINKGPKWIPAMIEEGRPVNAYRKQPVTFVVSEQ